MNSYDTFDWASYVRKNGYIQSINNKEDAWKHWMTEGRMKMKQATFKSRHKHSVMPKTFFEKFYTIYITRHICDDETSQYWRHNYKCIRKNYAHVNIVVIDDESNPEYLDNDESNCDVSFIKSEFPCRGELLPFYYYHRDRPTPYAIFIHDSSFIHGNIHELLNRSGFASFWSFSPLAWQNELKDDMEDILANIPNGHKLLKLYENSISWSGCFGCICSISIEYLDKMNATFSFLDSLLPIINTRTRRMCIERLLSLMHYTMTNKDIPFLFNDIWSWCNDTFKKSWGLTWNDYQLKYGRYRKHVVMKIWSGR